jgi:hypothetical protein
MHDTELYARLLSLGRGCRVTGLQMNGSGFVVRFDSVDGWLYDVLYKDDLMDTNGWLFLTNDWTGTGNPMAISDDASAPRRFYRVRARLP